MPYVKYIVSGHIVEIRKKRFVSRVLNSPVHI